MWKLDSDTDNEKIKVNIRILPNVIMSSFKYPQSNKSTTQWTYSRGFLPTLLNEIKSDQM